MAPCRKAEAASRSENMCNEREKRLPFPCRDLIDLCCESFVYCAQERLASHAEAQSRPEVQAIAAARAALPIAPYRCVRACSD